MSKVIKKQPAGKPSKPPKPHEDFPLFPHDNGRWAKKVRQKLRYFGKWSEDPKGVAALEEWRRTKDDLLAGRKPRPKDDDRLTVKLLVNAFIHSKKLAMQAGEITFRTWADYERTCGYVFDAFGSDRIVEDLRPSDFEQLKAKLTAKRSPTALANEIGRVRVLLNYAFANDLIDRPVKLGPAFKKPSRKTLRIERSKRGPRLFSAEQIRALIAKAGPQMKAMILLAANAGLGNHDCGLLELRHLDLKNGWLDFPRSKTGIERKAKLWPETVKAVQAALKKRTEPKDPALVNRVFVTKYGTSWAKLESSATPISHEFRKLIKAVDEAAKKEAKKKRRKPPVPIYRKGLNFYALRHVFETVGGESRDQVAVNAIMGHVDESMAGVYRERISDERLEAVAEHVRTWLYGAPKDSQKASPAAK